jgi:hypothetical protein
MPHLFSGLHQKRQSGTITTGTLSVGAKGMSSASRMVSQCKSTGTSTDCVNTVLNGPKPKPQIVEDIQNIQNIPENDLFNRKSFYRYFSKYDGKPWVGMGPPDPYEYALIDPVIINLLNQAANRWAMFIKVSDNAKYFIRAVQDPNWNGIELKGFLVTTLLAPYVFAECETYTVPPFTALVTGFDITINKTKFGNLGLNGKLTVLTHEFGHGLGISKSINSRDTNFRQILPLAEPNNSIQSAPVVLKAYRNERTIVNGNPEIEQIPIFPLHVGAYAGYGGIGTKQEAPFPLDQAIDQEIVKSNKLLFVAEGPVIPVGLGVGHFTEKTLYTTNWDDPNVLNTDKYYYLGLANEIMNGNLNVNANTGFRHYISMVSIGFLSDLRSETSNGTIYTYDEISSGNSEVLDVGVSQTNRLLVFTGVIISNLNSGDEKNIKDFDDLFCKDCTDENEKDINNDLIFTCTHCSSL